MAWRWYPGLAALLAGAALVAGCHLAGSVEARPALWRVADGDTTIWLLGTIHALPRDVAWQTPAITRAIESADQLVLEIPNDWDGTAHAFVKAAVGDVPPLLSGVRPERRPAFLAALKAIDVPIHAMGDTKTWAVALDLDSAVIGSEGADREYGVENLLDRRFAARGKPRLALETPAAQFAIFDALPEAEQRVLLDQAIDAVLDPARGYRAMLAAWSAGDTANLAASLGPTLEGAPVLEKTLVMNRNRRMADWIAGRMAQPGTALVAIGAGHFVGTHSVLAMLRADGLVVQRVE